MSNRFHSYLLLFDREPKLFVQVYNALVKMCAAVRVEIERIDIAEQRGRLAPWPAQFAPLLVAILLDDGGVADWHGATQYIALGLDIRRAIRHTPAFAAIAVERAAGAVDQHDGDPGVQAC